MSPVVGTGANREYAFDVGRKCDKPNVYAVVSGLIQTRVFDGPFRLRFLWQWRRGQDAAHGVFKLHSPRLPSVSNQWLLAYSVFTLLALNLALFYRHQSQKSTIRNSAKKTRTAKNYSMADWILGNAGLCFRKQKTGRSLKILPAFPSRFFDYRINCAAFARRNRNSIAGQSKKEIR